MADLTHLLTAGLLLPAGGLAGQVPDPPVVTAEQKDEFIAAVRRRDPHRLSVLFGNRIADLQSGAPKLQSAHKLLEALSKCAMLRVSSDDPDGDVFVEWSCPQLDHPVKSWQTPGYVTRLWHHPAGLTVGYAKYGVVVNPRPMPLPPSSTPRP